MELYSSIRLSMWEFYKGQKEGFETAHKCNKNCRSLCILHHILLVSFKILIYSSSGKSCIFCFVQLLMQILVKYLNQGQFQNLLVLRFPKLSLEVNFDENLAEKIKVKDNRLKSK